MNAEKLKCERVFDMKTEAEIMKALEEFHHRILKTNLSYHIWESEMMAVCDALDLINRQQAEIERKHKIVCDYAQAARTIELYLKEFCDKKLPYDEMIADASRKASAEIERLQKAGNEAVNCFNRMETLYKIKCKELETAKTEAIKEFAERLKKTMIATHKTVDGYCRYETEDYYIDNLVKEMVGDK